jgi:hypothetical protein
MSFTYTHSPPEESVGPESRAYSMIEGAVEYKGRQALYLYVVASDISFCDRNYAPHMASVNVKGYVVRWKYSKNERGEELSEIEPITDKVEKREISKLLREQYGVLSVNFL